MAKHTQAHITKTIPKNQSEFFKARTKSQTEYYMGAKLIEVGVDPKKAIYRWQIEDAGVNEKWTYSAYWGETREKIEREEGL
jgi:hypothetical protein